jgi:putative colanic acid biosynthesis UDP-glucose lipid carrier transferase
VFKGYLHAYASRVSFLQRLLDAALIFAVYLLVLAGFDADWDAKRMLAVVLAVVVFALLAEMYGAYRSWRTSLLLDEIRQVSYIWALTMFLLLVLAFATKKSSLFSRAEMLTWFVAVPLALALVRLFVRGLLRYARRNGANTRTAAIVGHNPMGQHLIAHLNSMSWAGLVVKGIFDAEHGGAASVRAGDADYPFGNTDDLLQKVNAGEIDVVYVALPLKGAQGIEDLISRLADTTASVYIVPDLFISDLMHSRWIDFGGMPLVSVYETPFYGVSGWVKRVEDIVLASVILLLSSPLMLAIAVAVKLSSPGAAIFKQRRYGLNGEIVEVWKFRSMTVCEDGEHVLQAGRFDARITPVGKFLRGTSLDELPQFINVLHGSMSVVGPRPHAVAHNEQYRKLIKGYMLRHKVKPGITGWAQVNGWRGETDTLDKMQKRIEYDLEYIQNWSLWLDIRIVTLTLVRGFAGKNVY